MVSVLSVPCLPLEETETGPGRELLPRDGFIRP
jgi:hypothetical protein